jgi:hypothetical protein
MIKFVPASKEELERRGVGVEPKAAPPAKPSAPAPAAKTVRTAQKGKP